MEINQQLAPFEKTKMILRSSESITRFAEVIGSERGAQSYISSVLIACAQSEQLQECTTQSIITSAMRAATLKLSVDPALGQAYMIPFKQKATFVIGFRGLHQLALRTGKYRHIHVSIVYEGQEVIEDQLKGVHSIRGLPKFEKGKWIPQGYMLYFELRDGYSKTLYMTVDEIHQHASRYSRTYSYKESAWKTNFDDMAKKTVLRLGLSKYGFFSPEDSMMMGEIELLDEESIDGEWLESATSQEEERRNELESKTTDELIVGLGFDPDPQEENPKQKSQQTKQSESSLF